MGLGEEMAAVMPIENREENDGAILKQQSSISFSLRGGDPNLQTTKDDNGPRGGTHRVVRLGYQRAAFS